MSKHRSQGTEQALAMLAQASHRSSLWFAPLSSAQQDPSLHSTQQQRESAPMIPSPTLRCGGKTTSWRAQRKRIAGTRLSSQPRGFLGHAPHALRCHDTGCRPSERVQHTVWTSTVCLRATVEHREHKHGSLPWLFAKGQTSRSAAQQWHAARGMQNLAKQPKDDHATSLGQNRSAPCTRGRQCAPRRSGAAIRQD